MFAVYALYAEDGEVPQNLIDNGSFEVLWDGWPRGWSTIPTASARFRIESNKGIDGSACLAISTRDGAAGTRAVWRQRVKVEPYTPYILTGMLKSDVIKGSGKHPATVGVNLFKMENGPAMRTTNFGWTKFTVDFAVGPTNEIEVQCALGCTTGGSTGTVYFDDLSLIRNPDVETFEGTNFIIHLYLDQADTLGADAVRAVISRLDAVCEAYRDLTGYTPRGGKQSAWAPVYIDIEAGGWSSDPILWKWKSYKQSFTTNWSRDGYCPELFRHEIAHRYDHPSWTFHAHFTEFKMYYALETLGYCIVENGWACGKDTRMRWDKRSQAGRSLGEVNEIVQIHKNILIRDEIGWEPFKKTYRHFLSLPTNDVPRSTWGKFMLWNDTLSSNASTNVLDFYSGSEMEFLRNFYNEIGQTKDPVRAAKETNASFITALRWSEARVGYLKPEYDARPSGERFHSFVVVGNAVSRYLYKLGGLWSTLTGSCGLARGTRGSVDFVIRGDGKELYRSGQVRDSMEREYAVDVIGVKDLELIVEDCGDGNRGDLALWLDPVLTR